MTREHIIRLVAGTFVMGSLALGWFVNPYWFLFTAFVGLNLFQSALTKWCLMDDILKKLNIGCSGAEEAQGG
jgi:hypothetical protein